MASYEAVVVERCWKSLVSNQRDDVVVYASADGGLSIVPFSSSVLGVTFDRLDWLAIRAMADKCLGMDADVLRPEPVGESVAVVETSAPVPEKSALPDDAAAFFQKWEVNGMVLPLSDYEVYRGELPPAGALTAMTGMQYREMVESIGLKVAVGRQCSVVREELARRKEAGLAVSSNGFHQAVIGGPGDAGVEDATGA